MKDLQVQLTGSWTTDVGSNLDQAGPHLLYNYVFT